MFERETPPGNNSPERPSSVKQTSKVQTVVRTRPTQKGYAHEPDSHKYLKTKLDEGYKVVMCTAIGQELEYILEK